MKIDKFKVEEWFNKYEKDAVYDLADTCVESLSINELLDFVYDREKETEIKRKNRLNIQKLFEAYANYKGLKDVNRLLDSLTTQNRVLTYEIRTSENYFYSL